MKYKISWSKDAGEELIEIISWYKYNVGINVARKISTKINSQVKKLKDMPRIGRQVSLLKDMGINEYLQVAIEHWIVYYRIEKDIINIISVIDERRDLEEILYKKIIDGKIK
ncbi:type II toxin-antitoxin system RelE/ParE family toxin [Leadbettera azotonutricia]|uniref:Plasmid stabilization system n=1 Tax=Leadbettera azotonutricia (strain ATCC BAA-888 / DSM 13862 / ZAS-9) TaxID=545695 RepID=F5YCK6_LEAAZ|nr:type II toxin-antitoxin system RelE/ParE family toxin [Leadbettera azotonutricia]AEF82886.1 plasmid stabilization system [Leadbettera azotonutricia ZAS-9]